MKINFEHHQTAHCENGVASNLLLNRGLKLSEPMIFGIGSGLFFVYLPFLKVNFAPGLVTVRCLVLFSAKQQKDWELKSKE